MLKEVGEYTEFVKSFGGTKVGCMKGHMKPTIREKLDHNPLPIDQRSRPSVISMVKDHSLC